MEFASRFLKAGPNLQLELTGRGQLNLVVGPERDSMIATCVTISAVAMGLLICVIVAKRNRLAFQERFPPISNAEFLDRCTPGTNPAVALKVRRIVAEHLAVEYELIYPSSTFNEDLGAG